VVVIAAPAAEAQMVPKPFQNCTAVNKKYPHGVGRAGARGQTKSGAPVTTFVRNTAIYKLAMSHNKDLDRDKDGIACEKK
jgi:Excalibur calcium-binding domain